MFEDQSGNALSHTTVAIKDATGCYYIDNQEDCFYSNSGFGDSTIASSGCGLIAVYNILLSRGSDATFMDVYNAAFEFKALANNGEDGMYLEATINMLEHLDNISSKTILKKNNQSILILYGYYDCKVKRHGGHYVAGIDRGGGEYTFYNDPFTPNNSMGLSDYLGILSEITLVDQFNYKKFRIKIDYIYSVGG